MESNSASKSPTRRWNPRDQQTEYFSRILHTPETVRGNPMRLTERGREQMQSGLRKCTNRDIVANSDPRDVHHIKSYEITLLVKPLVALGHVVNEYWSPVILSKIETSTNGWIRFPERMHAFQWETFFRWFAAENNLLFLILMCFTLAIVSQVLSWISTSTTHRK